MSIFLLISCLFLSIPTYSQSDFQVPDHIVIVILENHSYDQIIGSPEAPNINALAKSSNTALFTQSYAIEYPSQPNYLDLFSGCNQGVTDDNPPPNLPFTSANLARQLLDAGKTFVSYAEDLPYAGFVGESADHYVRRHNPAVYWIGTGANQIPASVIQPFNSFPNNFNMLPTVSFVIPNLDNDMHDGSAKQGDQWIFTYLFPYIQWAKNHNSLFILTFDEDETTQDNHIATLISGERVKTGSYSKKIDHYSILRTIEEMYKLPYACNATTAESVTGCWNIASGNPTKKSSNAISIYSNPLSTSITLVISNDSLLHHLELSIMDVRGAKLKMVTIQSPVSKIPLNELSAGIYVYQLIGDHKVLKKGKITVK